MKAIATVLIFAWGCQSSKPVPPPGPAKAGHANEADLPSVTLALETVSRLRIETAKVQAGAALRMRLGGGEVVVPPGRAIAVTAPVAGEVHFLATAPMLPGSPVRRGAALLRLTAIAPADRDTRARVTREVAAAEANLAALEARVVRNQALVDQRSGTARSLEEAIAARDIAKADLAAAHARGATLSHDPLLSDIAMTVKAPHNGVIRTISVAEGQAVAAGASLFEVVAVDALQVRVPVYSGDLGRLAPAAAVHVHRAGEQRSVEARFVPGPPTADPDCGTVDRFLALSADAGFASGERVIVELPLQETGPVMTVPASALVLDAWGGAWVYRCEGQRFTRVRVDPVRRLQTDVVIAHGPPVGTCVVSVGAVELFGTEFPPGH